jgi:hypothetical protein
MLKKYGRYYADWQDHLGKRHRQSFPTKKKALAFQARQRSTSLAKKAPASEPSRKSAAPGPRRTRPEATTLARQST